VTPEGLADVHAASFETDRGWSAREFTDLLSDSSVFALAARDGAAGFALGRAVAGEAELLTLAVAPHARRQGHGRALLEAFEAAARTRGAQEAFLEVAADNTPAIALYARAGYVERGRRRGYYPRPGRAAADALLLGRVLA
jgi:ribosomal-protein-alanine N-acetyltransferase